MNTFLNKANGITKGCEISNDNEYIFVQKGYFILHGRMVEIVGVEKIPSPELIAGELFCKVVFEIDLNQINTTSDFRQGKFKVLSDTSRYLETTKEDLDSDGKIYQMEWCQYKKNISGIQEFRDLRTILNLDSVWTSINTQNTAYKSEFDSYFATQKKEIERQIEELEAQAYVPLSTERNIRQITLLTKNWQGEAAPFTQTVSVEGMREIDNPILVSILSDTADTSAAKAYNKAFGIVASGSGTTADNSVTFRVYKKPSIDITVGLKGV